MTGVRPVKRITWDVAHLVERQILVLKVAGSSPAILSKTCTVRQTLPGVTIIPISRYKDKNGEQCPVQLDVEIWGKDLEAAKWMAQHCGFEFVDVGVIQSREVWTNPWEWLPSYN